MKIVNNMKRAVDIDDLKDGEIFLLNDKFYLKLASNYYVYERPSSERKEKMVDDIARILDDWDDGEGVMAIIESYIDSYNAVNLKTNTLAQIRGLVTPVDGELVLNGLK